MAEVIGQAPAPLPTMEDVAAANAEVARKLAAQDAAGRSTVGKPGEFEEAGTALDKLAAAVPDPNKGVEPVVKPDVTPAPDKAAEEAAAKVAAEKAAADAAAAAAAANTPPADPFKDVPALPQGTSAKAAESFEAIKVRATQEISARETQIAELKKQIAEAQQRASTPTTEQLAKDKELEEMRLWRAKMDVDFDPQFKQFDTKATEAREFIYAQLRESPAVTEEIIQKIKDFGGPEKTDLSKLFEAAKDPALQRIVEAKIADLKMIQFQKDSALKSTKANITSYLKERETAFQQGRESHNTVTQTELNKFLGGLEWFKEKPPGTDDASKKAADDYNSLLKEIKSEVADAMKDDSPQMRAILLTSYAQMRNYQRIAKSQEVELTDVKAKLADISAKYDKVKNASTSRLRESAAPANGQLPAKPADNFNTTAATALDNLARQVTEQRAAKGV